MALKPRTDIVGFDDHCGREMLNVHKKNYTESGISSVSTTEELQWLEHLWNHENMFEAGVV